MRKIVPGFIFLAILIGGILYDVHNHHTVSPTKTVQIPVQSQNKQTSVLPTVVFNKTAYSIDTPGSIWWVVNKTRPLHPTDYVPPDLVVPNIPLRLTSGDQEMHVSKQMATDLESLVSAGNKANVHLMLASGYRSYNLQVLVYNQNVKSLGQAGADQASAKPGTSEHQTGFAADLEPASRVCEVATCFSTTPEGIWLAAHAYQYGFIIRYPADKTAITGYEYEPWHVRYVGVALATELHNKNIETLEEFFGLPAAGTP